MNLAELLTAVPEARVQGRLDRPIGGLRYDSRKVQPSDLFVAWKGQQQDGHAFIAQACQRGSTAIVHEADLAGPIGDVTLVRVPRAREALGRIADHFYGHPSRSMAVVGITGTNGKTTSAFLTKYFLTRLGWKVGLLGTVRYEIADTILPSSRTTPEGSDLQALLARMRDEGCQTVVMEVSSHALDQGRVAGVDFRVAAWTNLTPDHLDYHGTMDRYFEAKKLLFIGTGESARPPVAVLNLDATYEQALRPQLPPQTEVLGCSLRADSSADLKATVLRSDASGTTLDLHWRGQTHRVTVPLLGRFNVQNILVALGAVLGLGNTLEPLLPHLASLPNVPGRLERSVTPQGVTVVVDYAHTPDALENVLSTLRELSPRRLLCVVGCGGNRDRTKRPLMASAAVRLSDQVIFTADNPRHESVAAIFDEMRPGAAESSALWVADRREAIARALALAQPGDLLCVAGKGHETTQEIKGVFLPFDDRRIVQDIIAGG